MIQGKWILIGSCLLSVPSLANAKLLQPLPDIRSSAEDVKFRGELSSVTLDVIEQLSNSVTSDPESLVERDQQICEFIGESKGDMYELARSDATFETALNADQEVVRQIDQANSEMIQSQAQLYYFCVRSDFGGYRDISSLKTRLIDLRSRISFLTKIAQKYLEK